MKYMLDTNILVFLIRNKSDRLIQRLKRVDISDVCVSSVTYAELVYGVEKSANKDKNRIALMTVLSGIKVLPYEEAGGEEYGVIRADLERKGSVIGPNDLLIASHAKALGLTLITNNMKEFGRINGLTVEDWTV